MPPSNVDVARLERLRDYYARYGTLPSYAGISGVVGFKAKTAAVKLAQRLIKAGFLRPAPGGKLVPTNRFFEFPLADSPVRAGSPDAIEGQVASDRLTFDSFFAGPPSKTVLVAVKGDSMRDAGIFDGDLAVVERSHTAQAGQFVIAVVDGAFTLKELRFEGREPVLIPHHAEMAPIRPTTALQVFGVVRGIVRRYGLSEPQRRKSALGGEA